MILHGNVIDMLRSLPAASVQLCVTSPPYWSLRDYKVLPTVWGGDDSCAHEWGDAMTRSAGGGQPSEKTRWQHTGAGPSGHPQSQAGAFCQRCGAWRGQLGLEPTIGMWVENLVAVFDEVRRVLKDDGVLFVNVGDSYSGGGRGGNPTSETSGLQGGQLSQQASMVRRVSGKSTLRGNGHVGGGPKMQVGVQPRVNDGLREKNLIGQPWRLAFALQDAGWYWRDTICWHKVNPMPSSVEDRCTPAWEPMLMFSKSARYYWNKKAIEEPASNGTHPRTGRAATFDRSGNAVAEHVIPGQSAAQHRARGPGNKTHKGVTAYEAGDERHRTKAGLVDYAERQRAKYKMPDNWATHDGAHGNFHRDGREKGAPAGREIGPKVDDVGEFGPLTRDAIVSARLGRGAGWRVRKLAEGGSGTKNNDSFDAAMAVMPDVRNKRNVWSIASEPTSDTHFAGYPTALVRPCVLAASRPGDTVLDPFSGRATTGVVALEYGREYIGIELSEAYVAMSRKRLACTTIGLPLESA